MLCIDLGVVIEQAVQINRYRINVILAQIQPDVCLPATDLEFEARPVGRKLVIAPMGLCRVTGDTVGRIKQFATRLLWALVLACRQGTDKKKPFRSTLSGFS